MHTKSGVVGPGADRTELHRAEQRIVLVVRGYHHSQAARDAIAYFHLLMADFDEPIEVVADLRQITGFDEDCRHLWQDGFREHTARIQMITLIQGTPLAKMAASALGLYLGIQVRSVENLENPEVTDILRTLRLIK